MENYFDNFKLGQTLLKWKWHLMIIVILSGIAGIAGSYLLEIKYKSTAVFYPSNIAPYGDESETEQMLQWLQGQDIRDSLITRFNLDDHYKIDSNYKYFKSTMEYELSQSIKINKTEYESIEIEVIDKDPEVACNMANAIMEFVTSKIRVIHREKFVEVRTNALYLLAQNDKLIEGINTDLSELSKKYGIINYEAQSEAVSAGYVGVIDGKPGAIVNNKRINELKKNLETHGAEFFVIYSKIEPVMDARLSIQKILDIAIMDANRQYTYINLISAPYVSDKKDSPKRLFVGFYAVIASLLLALVTISIIEGVSYNRSKNN